MVRIALTGGIASGKSFVADELAKRGARIIDADLLAREVVEPGTPGLASVAERFGDSILRPDGSLDRAALGEIIFNDPRARADLNAIIHPLVRERARELEEGAEPGTVVVQVIPLLVETGLHETFDRVIAVDVPTQTQVNRLSHRNDLSTDQARARVRSQASREQRVQVADWVIDNSGDQASTVRQVDDLWPRLVAVVAER